jgi:competence protein ComEA
MMIFVSGAVQAPGVYPLPAGARVVDALEAAGGFAPDANVNALNQAEPLHDGVQIYVPTLAEEVPTPPVGVSGEAASSSEGESRRGDGLINVNTATQAELESLPGIGETRAQEIIANRPFQSVDDLERVPGIGPATLEKLRPYVVVE